MFTRLFLLICLAFLSSPASSDGADNSAKPTLHVYTWEGYFAPDLLKRFEKENNCIIELAYYDSNETMIEKVHEGGGYDIITPPGFAISKLIRNGIIRKLDHSLLPNIVNLTPETESLSQDSGMEYSVPYTATVTGIGYNVDMVPEDALGSWNIFADVRFSGRLAMMNDMRETIGAALKYRGYSLNSTDPEEVREAKLQLQRWRKNIALFSIDEARYGLRDGKYAAIQGYHGDIAQMAETNRKIRFYIPKEGSAFNSDKFVVCSDCTEPELAHAFINFFLNGEVAALNMEKIKFIMPNSKAMEILGEKTANELTLKIDPKLFDKCEVVINIGPDNLHLYENAWENVLFDRDN